MKTRAFWILPLFLSLCSFTPRAAFQGKFYDETAMLDLTDSTAEEVDQYYSGVDTALSGGAFVASLYDTISKDNYFVSYSASSNDVNDWYKITDRNWALSQEIDPATYTFDQDEGTDYYLVQLYSSANDDRTKAYNTDVNGFKTDKETTAVDWQKKTRPSAYQQVDKEHVWAKSHGFAPGTSQPSKGAGTDLHHLIAADRNTNSAGHNDLDFGEVADKETAKTIYSYNADGSRDVSGYRGENAEGVEVFEPNDEWKGDVARALLYMATRYSHKGDNSKEEPYLTLTDDYAETDDNANYHGVQHGLSVFLEWNDEDKPDSYEKRRNDLIYKNVQNNRNPFVDHPEWARQAFAPETMIPVDFSGLKDSYQGYVGKTVDLGVTIEEDYAEKGYQIEATSSDETVATLTDDRTGLRLLKEGTATIAFAVTKDGKTETYATAVEVKNVPTLSGLPQNTGSYVFTIPLLKSQKLDLTLQGGFGETLNYTSLDESVATVSSDGVVRALKAGKCTIEVSIDSNGEKIVLAELAIEVTPNKTLTYILIIAVCAVVLIAILVLLFALGRKKKKKDRRKDYTKRRK